MPLDSPEAYERLGEHLSQIDPLLADFAATHGYTVYPKLSGGRYPNRRITQEGRLLRSIVVQMDCTIEGDRYDHYFPDIPYTIWGGAWVDDAEQRNRFLGPSIRVERVPFSALVPALVSHLQHFHGYLSGVTEQYILACGRVGSLGSPCS